MAINVNIIVNIDDLFILLINFWRLNSIKHIKLLFKN